MAINTASLYQQFQSITGCSPGKAKACVDKYLWACAVEMARDHFSSGSGSSYYISQTRLQNDLGDIRHQGRRHYIWRVCQSMTGRVFEIIERGSNLTERITMAQARYTLQDIIQVAGTPKQLVDEVYAPFAGEIQRGECDFVPIDLQSLGNYIHSTAMVDRCSVAEGMANHLDENLKAARRIYMLAQAQDGQLCQVWSPSVFGRCYYKGPNLQNTPKQVRLAALGDCHEYDIESSVFAWKLSWFHEICDRVSDHIAMPATLEYIDHKTAIRRRLAREVFDTDADWAVDVIKRLLTAIGFGAPLRSQGYKVENRYQQPALATIITAKTRLERALADPWLVEFTEEQNNMNQVILGWGKIQGQDKHWRTIPELVDARGRLRGNSVVSYLYQTRENEILTAIDGFCEPYDVLLTVHDCVYTRSAVPLAELRSLVREFGQYFNVGHSQNRAWVTAEHEDQFVQAHKRFIEDEERAAAMAFGKNYQPNLAVISSRTPPKNSGDHWSGSGYDGAYENYDAVSDPWFQDLSAGEQREYLAARQGDQPSHDQSILASLLSKRSQ